MIGTTISHYKILEKLGEGGMGEVYLAEDTKLDRTIGDPTAKERFIREAKAASALNHRNISTIHEIDEWQARDFICMEYVEGQTVKQKVKSAPLPLDEVIDIGIQLSAAMQEAHEHDIVHRDIKSDNIMVTGKGEVKVMDFGLAKFKEITTMTKTGTTMGTVNYMSPEQARGEKVDHKSDIWSMGVVLFEMLSGQLPFKGDYESAVIYAILNGSQEAVTALRTGVPLSLEQIVNKALSKTPAERYQHVDEMAVDLTAIKKQIETGNKTKQTAETRSSVRKPLYLYTGLAVLLILFVLLGIFFWPEQRTPINSIAVLPLDNLSGDPEQEYIVDGMTEVLITELSKIEALKVPSRTSSMRYKDSDESLKEIAEELQVGALVEGSAMLVGDKIRITAELIEAETDRHLWAES
jgi:non-specific serine/threonine protein kinase